MFCFFLGHLPHIRTYLCIQLGDPSRKIAARALELLTKLTRKHSAMTAVIVGETAVFLQRPNLSPRAKFNAVIFLNTIRFIRGSVHSRAAEQALGVYFSLFEEVIF